VNAVIKPKRCRVCRREFTPYLTTQVCCSPSCAIQYARNSAPQRQSAAQKRCQIAQAKEDRAERKRKSIPLSKLKSGAQHEFNAFIRERDFEDACISCGAVLFEQQAGGAWDAGHYRTVAAAAQLRFNEDNCHKQCKSCNSGVKRDPKGRVLAVLDLERMLTIRAEYRVRLIAKIGLERVEALENSHEIKHWERDELIAIRREYLGKWKTLKAARQ
jgi:hypothetical protein